MRRARRPGRTLAWQMLICVGFLSIWQWGYDLHGRLPWLVPDLLDPYFVSKPSDIFEHFLILSCLKSKLGVFNGWFNGEFARCMARFLRNHAKPLPCLRNSPDTRPSRIAKEDHGNFATR